MKTLLNKTLSIFTIASLFFACEGEQGPVGPQGPAGEDGAGASALVSVVSEPAGENCANGGYLINVGNDANGNGTLDSDEITNSTYICNGTDGAAFLVATTEEPAGENCTNGGFKVDSGLDDNGNGELDAEEIDETVYLCNGEDFSEPDLQALTSSVVDADLVFDVKDDFSSISLEMILTSADILPSDSSFVFGSYTDGAALFDNGDGTYAYINNLERDYSIARITMNSDLQPLEGDYIVNSIATAFTAQCAGSGISVEEHGFGPLYLSGGEWGGANKGVYVVDPYKDAGLADFATRTSAMGEWSTENAVVIGKDAYPNATVVFMGDDQGSNDFPQGHFAMYVGARGDLFAGQLYTLRVNGLANPFEAEMDVNTSYTAEWVKMTETEIDALNDECIDSLITGFNRIEDIGWRKGSAANQREVYFNVTGRSKPDLVGKGTALGRVYKVVLDENDPTAPCTITPVIDADVEGGPADGMHSPDNIVVTENYAYIQEDPNGYFSLNDDIVGWAKIWQYDLNTGDLKVVLEADQSAEGVDGIYSSGSTWEFTGMIDVTDVIGSSTPTFICGVQVHGWEADNATTGEHALRADGKKFFDPTAIAEGLSDYEGSFVFKIEGLAR